MTVRSVVFGASVGLPFSSNALTKERTALDVDFEVFSLSRTQLWLEKQYRLSTHLVTETMPTATPTVILVSIRLRRDLSSQGCAISF